MNEDDFERIWRAAVRFRNVSRELRGLLHEAFFAIAHQPADISGVKHALESLFAFLITEEGRSDANCSVTDAFFCQEWPREHLPDALRAIVEDAGGALHDTIYAPHIARNFDATPEQLLERVRKLHA